MVPKRTKKRELFGEIAVRMNFATKNQIEKALKRQAELKKRGKHKLIGIILLEMNILGSTELIAVLKEIESQQQPKKTRRK